MIFLITGWTKLTYNVKKIPVFLAFLVIISGTASKDLFAAEIVDRIIAVVNDEIITYTALSEVFAPYQKMIKGKNYPFAREMEELFKMRENLIYQLIDQKLTQQEAERLGIEVGDQEVNEAIERTKSMNSITDEKLRAMLKAEGMSMKSYKKSMKNQLLKTRLIQYEVKSKIIITNEEVEAYYARHLSEFDGKLLPDVTEMIKDKIYRMRVEKKFTRWISDLRKKAHIKIIQ